ncbi:MAG: flagellar protein FliT [Sulfuritalea sp.]|nr:flagellar protein FliT [Sulfuritalea sp.]
MATMHRMPSQIELYEEMSLLSSRMVEAARAGDWDNLIELEHGVSSLRNALMATPEDSNSPATDLNRRRSLIQRILEDDAEVRRHTEPWMEHVRKYLGDSARRRDVEKAYAAGAGESAAGSFGA